MCLRYLFRLEALDTKFTVDLFRLEALDTKFTVCSKLYAS